jgi:putative transposase
MYFLTMATDNHKPWFRSLHDKSLILQVMDRIKARFDLHFDAWVIMPDHVHWLISPNMADYSKVVFAFKRGVGAELKKAGKLRDGEKLWQSRFWEHTIRDDEDLRRCVEYIHFNPVKHGYVDSPHEWEYSSFHQYVAEGFYPADWAEGGDAIVDGAEYDR